MTIFAKTVVKEGRIPFELSVKQPNHETIFAMLEAEKLVGNPAAKRYTNFTEALHEAISDEKE